MTGIRPLRGSPLALAAALLLSLFAVEFGVMMALWRTLPRVSPLTHALIDASALALFAAPAVYLLMFHPVSSHAGMRRESEERYRHLMESSVDAIVSCAEDRTIVDWNPAAEEMFGYSREEVVGNHLDDIVVPEGHREGHVEGYQRFIETGDGAFLGRTVETEAVRRSGDAFPVEMSLAASRLNGSLRFTAIIRDITRRKQTEMERELLFDVTRAVHESDDFEEALDRSLKEIFDRTGWVYGEVWVPDDENGALRLSSSRHDDGEGLNRFEEVSRNSSFEPGEGLPGRVWESGEPEWIPDVSTEPESHFLRTSLAADAGLRAALGVPAAADGEVVAVMVFFMFEGGRRDARMVDLVAAVAGELGMTLKRRRLEEQVERSRDELEVLNRLVRHDIRNDMQLITGWGDMLRDHVDDEGREILDRVLEESHDVIELTLTARDYSAVALGGVSGGEDVDLSAVLEQEVEEIRSRFSETEVSTDVPPGIRVRAGPALHSVFRNLLHNAVQHNDKETPRITITVEETDGEVEVGVADNGPGIPEELRPRLFSRGEKGLRSQGTGVGLYLVKTLVEKYGGDVRAEDNEPEGTVFRVRLNRSGGGGTP